MKDKGKNYSLINARNELDLSIIDISKNLTIPIMNYGSYEAGRIKPPKEIQNKLIDFFENKGLLVDSSYMFQNVNETLENFEEKYFKWDV